MGVHYVNGSLVGDAVLNPREPEALVYERRGQNPAPRRARVHRLQKCLGGRGPTRSRPTLFGREFDLVDSTEPVRTGIRSTRCTRGPGRSTRCGDFFAWNPRVNC